jgi:hypothetical protein
MVTHTARMQVTKDADIGGGAIPGKYPRRYPTPPPE